MSDFLERHCRSLLIVSILAGTLLAACATGPSAVERLAANQAVLRLVEAQPPEKQGEVAQKAHDAFILFAGALGNGEAFDAAYSDFHSRLMDRDMTFSDQQLVKDLSVIVRGRLERYLSGPSENREAAAGFLLSLANVLRASPYLDAPPP